MRIVYCQENGGGTVVENTTIGVERDIKFLRQLSQATGVHIVAGTGIYHASHNISRATQVHIVDGDAGTGILHVSHNYLSNKSAH